MWFYGKADSGSCHLFSSPWSVKRTWVQSLEFTFFSTFLTKTFSTIAFVMTTRVQKSTKDQNWRVFSNYLVEMNIFYMEYLVEMQCCFLHDIHEVKKCQKTFKECFYRTTIFTWAKWLRTFRIIRDLIFYVSYLSVNKIG